MQKLLPYIGVVLALVSSIHAANIDVITPVKDKAKATGNVHGSWTTNNSENINGGTGSSSGVGSVITMNGQVMTATGSGTGSGQRDSQGNPADADKAQGTLKPLAHSTIGSLNERGSVWEDDVVTGSGRKVSKGGKHFQVSPNGTVIQLDSSAATSPKTFIAYVGIAIIPAVLALF